VDQDVWQKPVFLERYGQPGIITVSDTHDAARLLFRHYRLRKTLVLETALLTCRNAIIGEATSAMARYEFIEAAVSAGYHILPETFLRDGFRNTPQPAAFENAAGQPDAVSEGRQDRGKTPSPKELLNELLRTGSELFHLLADQTTASVLNALKATEIRRLHPGR